MDRIPGGKAARLVYWQDWVGRNAAAYEAEATKFDKRERLYRGEETRIEPLTQMDTEHGGRSDSWNRITHLRNIISENIESTISSSIPQPKVTARRKADEWRAKLLEDMLRNELDRLPFEELNDRMERTVPIQGGGYWLVEWDNSVRTHSTVGDVRVSIIHPRQIVPQDGVFTSVEDMDAVALKLPQTREYIRQTYNVEVDDGEEHPDARTLDGDDTVAEDMVTQIVVYYRNNSGGIGKFSYVGDTVLEDMDDWQARRLTRCAACGATVPHGSDTCPSCGSKSTRETTEDEETLRDDISTGRTQIPAMEQATDELGMPVVDPMSGMPMLQPTVLPSYTPDTFPVFLQRNITLFGRLLGDSDVDKIADQQNTLNRINKKIIDRLVKAGTRVTLPDRADFRVDPDDNEVWYIGSPQDKSMIDVMQFSGDLRYEMEYRNAIYEEARQLLGITDSFQGRKDTTAQSAIAKQFSAAQSAGRLESRRKLKDAAYAELFRRIVQLKVAYADEPRPVVSQNNRGKTEYDEFNRYDFYEQDDTGRWHCILDDDRFLFSCDSSAPLAANREQMWQEAVGQYQMGAYGDPAQTSTRLLYWQRLNFLHYPGAEKMVEMLEEQQRQEQEQMMMQQAQQMAMQEAQRRQAQQDSEQQMIVSQQEQARKDALQAVQQRMQRNDRLAQNEQKARSMQISGGLTP
ncbi:MAG: hypothetical protein MJ074_10710 [Oscillospiraceae bacterium]|nr:hypothetical protein [Oscillospiraceae bacterium]